MVGVEDLSARNEQGDDNSPRQVQVRFRTRQKQYEVTDSAIFVPTHLRRFGLSEIINHLLNLPKPVPFDFIIDGKFLRTNLEAYLESNNLSQENIIETEYVKSSLPPTPTSTIPHDDWISSICGAGNGNLIATGCYDGRTRLWSLSASCVATFESKRAVKAVAWLANTGERTTVLAGGEDRRITLWEHSASTDMQQALYECVGHDASIESISVSPTGQHFASASWDSSIRLWSTSPADVETDAQDSQDLGRSKRKRLDDRATPKKNAVATLAGHVGAVSSVAFSKTAGADERLYSGGWDHSVRIWDTENTSILHSMSCEQVVLALDHSSQNSLIATGHSDSAVRLWDPRDQKGLVVKLKLGSHTNMVSSISWGNSDVYSLASASYDGHVKIWDIRSSTPLHTVKGYENDASGEVKKLFAVVWDSVQGCVLAGGEEGKLRVFSV
ncbi:WD40-repeat-containing domain protein [Zopfochytrium polystomum]|nr:WD40-repeat-containing domain protein [Zopfochytrium polystomum]